MKTVCKLTVCIILLLGLFSCSKGIYKSAQMIKRMEEKKYNQSNDYVDSLYKSYFLFREKVVNKFLEKKKLKDFILSEKFNSYIGVPYYDVYIDTPDSIYSISVKDKGKISQSLSASYGSSYYRNDSFYISRHHDYYHGGPEPMYYSRYKNGRLVQLNYSDSVIYQTKKGKMQVDFSIFRRKSGKDGECYIKDSSNLLICTRIIYKCIRNKGGEIEWCDTLYTK